MNNRIDRIDGNKYYEYTKIKNLNVPDTDEKFSLDYKQDEIASQKEEKKEKTEDKQSTGQSNLHDGVRLDISSNARLADTVMPKKQPDTASQNPAAASPLSILISVKEIVVTALTAIKEFFYNIWNDPQPQSAEQTDNAAQTDAAQQIKEADPGVRYESTSDYHRKEALLDREIQPYLRNGDLNQVISLLTDNGKRAAARNSTLLTYYDRNGNMVEPNASDRERILYGDRNTRKL